MEEVHIFEAHIFIGPVGAPPETIDRFLSFCQELSDSGQVKKPFKGLRLVLCFDNDNGDAIVLQTSQYITNTLNGAKEEMYRVADLFEKRGFQVLRRKLEGATGSEWDRKDGYYEVHMRLDADISKLGEVKALSKKLSETYNRPVPVSYNSVSPHQMFVNFRTRGVGWQETEVIIKQIAQTIKENGISVVKEIREYVASGSDDNIDLDKAWIEYK